MGDSRPEECASTEAWAHKPTVPHRKKGVGKLERQTRVSTWSLSLAASHATGATDQEVGHGWGTGIAATSL